MSGSNLPSIDHLRTHDGSGMSCYRVAGYSGKISEAPHSLLGAVPPDAVGYY